MPPTTLWGDAIGADELAPHIGSLVRFEMPDHHPFPPSAVRDALPDPLTPGRLVTGVLKSFFLDGADRCRVQIYPLHRLEPFPPTDGIVDGDSRGPFASGTRLSTLLLPLARDDAKIPGNKKERRADWALPGAACLDIVAVVNEEEQKARLLERSYIALIPEGFILDADAHVRVLNTSLRFMSLSVLESLSEAVEAGAWFHQPRYVQAAGAQERARGFAEGVFAAQAHAERLASDIDRQSARTIRSEPTPAPTRVANDRRFPAADKRRIGFGSTTSRSIKASPREECDRGAPQNNRQPMGGGRMVLQNYASLGFFEVSDYLCSLPTDKPSNEPAKAVSAAPGMGAATTGVDSGLRDHEATGNLPDGTATAQPPSPTKISGQVQEQVVYEVRGAGIASVAGGSSGESRTLPTSNLLTSSYIARPDHMSVLPFFAQGPPALLNPSFRSLVCDFGYLTPYVSQPSTTSSTQDSPAPVPPPNHVSSFDPMSRPARRRLTRTLAPIPMEECERMAGVQRWRLEVARARDN